MIRTASSVLALCLALPAAAIAQQGNPVTTKGNLVTGNCVNAANKSQVQDSGIDCSGGAGAFMTRSAGNAVTTGATGPGTGSAIYNLLAGGAAVPVLSTAVRPTTLGNWGSIDTAFTGDLRNMSMGFAGKTTGVSIGTTGAPASGYLFTQELARVPSYSYNTSGNNQSTSTNDGRTGVLNFYAKNDNYGQGDSTGYFCDGFVSSSRAGATSFLASPQVGCISGQMLANADGSFLQGVGDINLNDRGFDVAAVASNFNFTRTNATGGLNVNWGGYTAQNSSSVPVDWMARFTGPTRLGLDTTGLTIPDKILTAAPTVAAGGSGYGSGTVTLTASGGTCHQQPTFLGTITAGAISSLAIDRAGLCNVPPANPVTLTGGTGTGAQATLAFNGTNATPLIVSKAHTCWYMNASNDTGVYNTQYSSTAILGQTYSCYDSSLGAVNHVVAGGSVLQEYGGAVGVIVPNGIGGFRAGLHITTKTSNYPVTVGDMLGSHFDNTNAVGEVDFTLPAAAAGLSGCFAVTTAQTVKIIANGTDKIAIGTSNSSAGGSQSANALYGSVCIEAHGTGQWFATSHEGTWTGA